MGALSRGLGVGAGVDPVYHARVRVLRHLRRHPRGVSKEQMYAWLHSVSRFGGLGADPTERIRNYERAMKDLVADALIVCTNGVWWMREKKT